MTKKNDTNKKKNKEKETLSNLLKKKISLIYHAWTKPSLDPCASLKYNSDWNFLYSL